jgi:ATP/maltotriose-dependent transcriptional regulator MalT
MRSYFDLGHWDELIAEAESLLERWQGESVLYEPWAQSQTAAVHVWRGEVAEAQALSEKYLDRLREIEDLHLLIPALATTARILYVQGEDSSALDLIDEAYHLTEGKALIYTAMYLPDVVRILVGAREIQKAEGWISHAEDGSGRQIELAVASAQAIMAEAEGDLESAAAMYEENAGNWRDFGHALEEAMASLGAGRCLIGIGRDKEAEVHLASARIIFERLGAAPMIAEIDDESDQAAAL